MERPQSDHDSTPGGSLPLLYRKTLETRSREDLLDRRLQEMNQRIKELHHAPPDYGKDICTDPPFSQMTINTISGGPRKGAAIGSIGPLKRQRTEGSITFTEEDAREIQFSHNDTVVVSLNITDYEVRRILVDSGSSADILFYDIF